MVYSKIFKQAYEIARDYKFLWILGLFLVVVDIAALGATVEDESQINSMNGYAVLGIFILLILFTILRYRAKAAMIIAVKAIVDKEETSFNKSFGVARFFYWRVFGISLLIRLAMGLLFVIIFTPVSYLSAHGQVNNAIFLGILGAIIFIPAGVVALIVNILAPLYIVIFDQKIEEAFNKSYELFRQYSLVLLAIGLLMFILHAAALFLGGFMVELISGSVVLKLILASVVYLIFGSFISIFAQSVWVLVFMNLVKPQKYTSEEPIVAPEIASQ